MGKVLTVILLVSQTHSKFVYFKDEFSLTQACNGFYDHTFKDPELLTTPVYTIGHTIRMPNISLKKNKKLGCLIKETI